MPSGEKKYYKAIYFDLKMKALEKHFSANNPQKAYRKRMHNNQATTLRLKQQTYIFLI